MKVKEVTSATSLMTRIENGGRGDGKCNSGACFSLNCSFLRLCLLNLAGHQTGYVEESLISVGRRHLSINVVSEELFVLWCCRSG